MAKMLEKEFITLVRQTLLEERIFDGLFSKINALDEILNKSLRVCVADTVALGLKTFRPAPLALSHGATSRVASRNDCRRRRQAGRDAPAASGATS